MSPLLTDEGTNGREGLLHMPVAELGAASPPRPCRARASPGHGPASLQEGRRLRSMWSGCGNTRLWGVSGDSLLQLPQAEVGRCCPATAHRRASPSRGRRKRSVHHPGAPARAPVNFCWFLQSASESVS